MPRVTPNVEYRIRNFDMAADIPALLRLLSTIHGPEVSEDELRAELAWPNQEPEHDRWVAELDGRPDVLLGYSVGYHTIPERYLMWGEVHPNWRRRGIGTALLAHSVQRARALGVEHILINAVSEDLGANSFLARAGFARKGDIWYMEAPATIPLAAPIWPPGYTVRTFAGVKSYQVLKDAYYGSCGDLWGHGANSKIRASIKQPIAEEWAQWFPDDDQNGEGIFFAFAPDGAVVGLCRGILGTETNLREHEQPTGYIDALGIAPAHRVYALQQPLTLTVMHWMRDHGQGSIVLEAYGIDEPTVNLYRDIGFHLDRRLIAYNMNLSYTP
jgi:ribosomal protein S18 acetylase RimI-like enzyme